MSLLTDELQIKAQEMELSAAQGFGQFPRFKKILIVVLIVAIIPVYVLTRFLSQAYYTNQYKNLIIAARPSFTDAKPVSVLQTGVLPSGPGTYAAYAYVANQNLELSSKEINYVFTFYDDAGKSVGTEPGTFFLLPNEKKYLIAARVESAQKIVKASVSFSNMVWQKKLSFPTVKITATQPALFDQFDPPALTAQGSIVNNSAYLLSDVRIVFLLYDNSKNLVAVSQREEFTLKAGERRTYSQLWPSLQSNKVASIQVLAETNVLDSKNLAANSSGIAPSNSSNLSRPTNGNQ